MAVAEYRSRDSAVVDLRRRDSLLCLLFIYFFVKERRCFANCEWRMFEKKK